MPTIWTGLDTMPAGAKYSEAQMATTSTMPMASTIHQMRRRLV